MMALMSGMRRLGLCSAVLAAMAVVPSPWLAADALAQGGNAETASEMLAPPPLVDLTNATLENLRMRPLFSPERRSFIEEPPVEETDVPTEELPAEQAPVEAASTYPDWTLMGVVRSQSLNRAIFRLATADETFGLDVGESRDGWTLTLVNRSSVTLESQGNQAELPLGVQP
jgi:hypothetical protein